MRHYRRHRRRHRRHYHAKVQRPIVATKHYTRVVCRQVKAIIPYATQYPGAWEGTSVLSWQQPEGLFTGAYYGFNFTGSEFFAHYKNYE